MTTHENAPTNAQILELGATVLRQIPKDLSLGEARFLIDNPKVIRGVLLGLKAKARKHLRVTEAQLRTEWMEFYDRIFGIGVDLSSVKIPDEQSGFGRVLFIPQGLSINQTIDACQKYFEVNSYLSDLDSEVPISDRSPESGSYVIRLRDRREADKELKNLSANELCERNIKGITLLERLVSELKYHDETGEHLDVKNVTLCNGSRYSNGGVPHVSWHGGELTISWEYPDRATDCERAREVIAL